MAEPNPPRVRDNEPTRKPTAEPALPDDAAFAEIRQLLRTASQANEQRLRALLAQAEQQRQPWHIAFATAGLAFALTHHDAKGAMVQARSALLQMQALNSRVGQGMAWTTLGIAHRDRGEMAESVAALQSALEIARGLGTPIEQAGSLSNLSLTLERVGRREAGLACLEEALALVPDARHPSHAGLQNNTASSLANNARMARDEGQPRAQWQPLAERAVHLARELIAGAAGRSPQHPLNPNYPRGCLARALVVLDELDEAMPILQDLAQIYSAQSDHYALQYVQLELARAWLQAGQPAQAREVAQQAIALAREHQLEQFLEDLWRVLSQAHEALAEWQSALQAFQAYHARKLHTAMQHAEASARSLAVQLDTDRALRESRIDALTGLLNRRGFDEALAAGLALANQAAPLTLLLIDMDFFKAVNDRDGHARGDQALALLGRVLKSAGRPHDQAARLGGDEFAWFGRLQAGRGLEVAHQVQQLLRAESLASWPDRPPLTLSIGIAETGKNGAPEDLLQRADQALYAAKAAGRDCARCD
jgi:diguanylate cyclase (GGDEF)-like protein